MVAFHTLPTMMGHLRLVGSLADPAAAGLHQSAGFLSCSGLVGVLQCVKCGGVFKPTSGSGDSSLSDAAALSGDSAWNLVQGVKRIDKPSYNRASELSKSVSSSQRQ